jgi:transposase
MKCLNITRKRTKRIVRKSEAYISLLKEKRSVFIQCMHAKKIQDVISIDESGFHKQMGSKYAYAPSGTKVYHQTTSQRHQNYSLILAISSSLVIASKIVKGGVKKDTFHTFLSDELLPIKYTFLLDNVRFHHSKSIKQLIISHGHSIEYTPPYSPDLNPVEHVFSVLKSKVRKQH